MLDKWYILAGIATCIFFVVLIQYRHKMKQERRRLEFDIWSREVEARYLKKDEEST